MLKERVKELMDRYEYEGVGLTAVDVLDELQIILDEEGDNSDLDVYLMDAVRQFVWQRHEYERYGGRCDDGGETFIHEVERIIGYNG